MNHFNTSNPVWPTLFLYHARLWPTTCSVRDRAHHVIDWTCCSFQTTSDNALHHNVMDHRAQRVVYVSIVKKFELNVLDGSTTVCLDQLTDQSISNNGTSIMKLELYVFEGYWNRNLSCETTSNKVRQYRSQQKLISIVSTRFLIDEKLLSYVHSINNVHSVESCCYDWRGVFVWQCCCMLQL